MKTKLWAVVIILVVHVANASAAVHAASSGVTTIISSEDSYVDNAKPATNFGSIVTMWIRGNTPTRRGLLRFNLAAIPSNARISSAILKLFVSSDGSPVAGNVNAVNGSWAENTVTYSTAPQVGVLIAALPNPASPNSSVFVDLTSSVIGKSIVDFYILSSNNDGVVYYTREKGTTQSPKLIITWTTDPTSTPTPVGTMTASMMPTPTVIATSTSASTPTALLGSSATPTNTPTAVPSDTPVFDLTAVDTSTPTDVSTATQIDTPTSIPSVIPTFTPTFTPTTPATLIGSPTSPPNPILTFTPAADTYVQSDSPTTSYGTATQIVTDNSPVRRMLLKFMVSGVGTRSIVSAKLRLYCVDPSPFGGEFHRVTDTTWGEGTVNWNNAPVAEPVSFATLGSVTTATWYEIDVTSLVTGDGTFSLQALSTSTDGAYYSSKEGTAGFAPQLVITTSGATPTPTVTLTSSLALTPTAALVSTATPTHTPLVAPTSTNTLTASPTPPPTGSDPAIMAAGDIICDSLTTSSVGCQQMAASQVVVDQGPAAALILGDLCHTPSVNCFDNYFNPSWGRLFSISHPVTGNHDYLVAGAVYYFDYWNGIGNPVGRAGDRSQGYYSFDIGAWHLIALNSQCSEVGGCGSGSPQYTWLQQDLQTHTNLCTLAYYHIPIFSSGGRAASNMRQIYTLLYNNNAEVVLDGHDHIYERFAPQDPNGLADPSRGIREFIVGTGGANHTSIAAIQPNSEVRNTDTFGALKLTLHSDGYDWQFIPVAGKTFTDSGTTLCH